MAEANIAIGGWCTRRRPDRLAGATVAAIGVATAGRQQEIGFAILAVQWVERQVSGASTPARRALQQPAVGKTVAGREVVGGPGEGAVGIALRELPPHLFKERNRTSLVGSPDVAFTDQVDDWRGRAGAVASLPRTAAPRGVRQIAAAGAESDQDDGSQSSASALERHGHGRRRPLELAAICATRITLGGFPAGRRIDGAFVGYGLRFAVTFVVRERCSAPGSPLKRAKV